MKKQVVKEWIERGTHDLEVAKILLDEEEYSDVILFHVHQAVEKYLKGFLISKGWKLKKIHITAFYYEERYPPGPITSYSKEEIKEILEMAEEIIDKRKERIKWEDATSSV
jgi:HEPN domain-containing protein